MSAVLVTGATGFVGTRLVEALAARGRRVHAFVRSTSDRGRLERAAAGGRVAFEQGDLTDVASLGRALAAAGADGPPDVVHCGARISYATRDAEVQRRVNVGGTWNVLEAARQRPVGRIVHVSSVVAVGFARGDELLHEDWEYNGAELRADYPTTKRAAEDLMLAATDFDVVVVNPGAIFGPTGADPNSGRALRRLAAGRVPFSPPGRLGVVGLDDVVDGILRALERGRRGRRYLLVESGRTYVELFGAAARQLGVRAPRAVSPAAFGLARAAVGVADRFVPLRFVTPQALRLAAVSFAADSTRAREELGWSPRPFADVLGETVADLRAGGGDA